MEELLSKKWRPLHFPGGKAPEEAWIFFNDPAQTITTLLWARPFLDDALRSRVDKAVASLVGEKGLPAAFPNSEGEPRERYDIPEKLLRLTPEPRADDLSRLYPLWLWSRLHEGSAWIKAHWPELRDRIKLPAPREVDDCGNARLAGFIAYCRLARALGDEEAVTAALPLTRQAMRERLRYEFAHPRGGVLQLVRGRRSVVSRWRHLTPDVAALLARHSRPVTQGLVRSYVDKQRPGWWLAWNVEQLWANENPLQLPGTPYDFFAARALILREPRATLASFVDLPWCAGDEFYIRKIALALGADEHVAR